MWTTVQYVDSFLVLPLFLPFPITTQDDSQTNKSVHKVSVAKYGAQLSGCFSWL